MTSIKSPGSFMEFSEGLQDLTHAEAAASYTQALLAYREACGIVAVRNAFEVLDFYAEADKKLALNLEKRAA